MLLPLQNATDSFVKRLVAKPKLLDKVSQHLNGSCLSLSHGILFFCTDVLERKLFLVLSKYIQAYV